MFPSTIRKCLWLVFLAPGQVCSTLENMFTGGASDLSDSQSREVLGKPFRHGRMALPLGLHDLQTLQCKKYVFVDQKKKKHWKPT